MNVDPSQASTEQAMVVDEPHDLRVRGDRGGRQRVDEPQHFVAPFEGAARQLARDERVRHDTALVEQLLEVRIRSTEMIDPDRGVDEHGDYFFNRRRRGAAARVSEPPIAASRLALSRATSALSPS